MKHSSAVLIVAGEQRVRRGTVEGTFSTEGYELACAELNSAPVDT